MDVPGGVTIRVSAPGRANLIGNPGDLYGGAVLACTVPLRAHVEIEPADQTVIRVRDEVCRIEEAADLEPRGDAFDLGRVALRARPRGDRAPCRIAYASDLPQQSGMGGSSALLVALLRALDALDAPEGRGGDRPDLLALVKRARHVERDLLGVACGWTDFYMAAFGGLRYMDFEGLEVEQPPERAPSARLEDLSGAPLPFVLAFTGVRHHSGEVHRPIRERWERGEPEVVAAYERVALIASEGRAAFLARDWPALGGLMNENHAIQRGLGGSGEVNDRLIEAALAAGASGAKLAGAGHGGTIVALWPDPDGAPLAGALRAAGAQALYRPAPHPGVTLE